MTDRKRPSDGWPDGPKSLIDNNGRSNANKSTNSDSSRAGQPFQGGGYVLSTVNNTAYTINKVLEYSWAGVRYSVTQKFDMTAAYYHFEQNSYAANHCSNTSASSCSGLFHDGSFVADYRWTRRFDTYAGVNYSSGSDGLASGFLYNTDWAPMIGVRFNF